MGRLQVRIIVTRVPAGFGSLPVELAAVSLRDSVADFHNVR
jgi:hypothetical protein